MKTSVTTLKSSDALARKRAATAHEERRKRRHPRRKERRNAQGSAKGRAAWRKSGADARVARRKQEGRGGLSHCKVLSRVQCKVQRAARVDAHDVGEQEAPVGGVVTFWQRRRRRSMRLGDGGGDGCAGEKEGDRGCGVGDGGGGDVAAMAAAGWAVASMLASASASA